MTFNFNFNFPKITFVEKAVVKSALVLPYHNEDEEIIFDQNIKEFKAFKNELVKKSGSVLGFYSENTYVVLVNIKKKDIESSIVKAIKTIPESIKDISVIMSGYDFYDKLLVSKLLFELKDDWSLKTKKDKKVHREIHIVVKNAKKHSSLSGELLASSQAMVQQLVNMPSNYLTPTVFAQIAEDFVAKEKNKAVTSKILGKKDIEHKKMGSFLGVSKGSVEEPKLITLSYKGNPKSKKNDVVLVGKGLTFDSGGISIKPSLGMGAMKGDMAGAATSFGAFVYAVKAQLPINLVMVAACCENMPSGHAVKPGDVLTAMNGTTIEVVDTDAEGRLVLADALLFAQEFDGKYTIDMATLTGACIVALGYVHTGMFTDEKEMASLITDSGLKMNDKVWQLPMLEDHEEMLESKVADISNLCIGKGAGAQNGAIFLKKFAPKNGWCHLDIAGTSAQKGGEATSRPMAMLSELLDNIN